MPERVDGAAVWPSLFPMLGVQAEIGRIFLPEEEQPGRDNVVLLSHGLWQRRFGADRSLASRTISLNGRDYTVAGVLPAGFHYPGDVEIWAPLAFAPNDLSPNNRGSHGLEVLARIKPGLTLEQARADMAGVTRRMVELHRDYPYSGFDFAVILKPLLEETVGDIKTALWIMLGAVGFVLLIACTNIANLLLARWGRGTSSGVASQRLRRALVVARNCAVAFAAGRRWPVAQELQNVPGDNDTGAAVSKR